MLDASYQHLPETAKKIFGELYCDAFDSLAMLVASLRKYGINAKSDLCVFRSHEYYTGLSFEIDVVSESVQYYEIAGGGRFDKLVSSFLTETDKNVIVPSTGFAFGVERLIEAATGFGLMSNLKHVESFIHLDETSADTLLIPRMVDNDCDAYIIAMEKVKSFSPDRRTNIYVGGNHKKKYLNKYAYSCGIMDIEFD